MTTTKTIQLLVTLHGDTASVSVTRLARRYTPRRGDEDIVTGRSFGDVQRAIETAALESQGRTA